MTEQTTMVTLYPPNPKQPVPPVPTIVEPPVFAMQTFETGGLFPIGIFVNDENVPMVGKVVLTLWSDGTVHWTSLVMETSA